MANNLTINPLYFDTTGGYFDGKSVGNIKSILFSGNTDTDSTVLLYNARNVVRNGLFQVWDRGTSTAPEGWVLSGASATEAREATIVPTSLQTHDAVPCVYVDVLSGNTARKITKQIDGRFSHIGTVDIPF